MVPTGSLKSGLGSRPIDIGLPAAARTLAQKRSAPSGIVRLVFALFVFSIPFETIDILLTGNTFSLSRLIGFLMIGVALTQKNTCFARPPAALWVFAVYLLIVALVGVSEPSGFGELIQARLLTLLQLLVLFWIASNLLRYPRVARSAIAALAAATLIVAMLDIAGIGMTVVADSGRISMFGEDPNSLAGMLSLGILAWIVLGRELKRRSVSGGKYWLAACLVIAVAIIRTGSRGGVVALLIGILALLFEKREGRRRGGSGWAVIAVALIVVLGLLMSATNVTRWQATLLEGKFSDRDRIAAAAWAMFLERPLTGWGPVRNIGELGARQGPVRNVQEFGGRKGFVVLDTHNGLLWVLTEVGIVGSIPYVLGLWLCLRAAWRGRARAYGILPFALVLCVLAINMSVTWSERKFYWLVLGLGVASSRVVEPRNRTGTHRAPLGPLKTVRGAG